MSLTRETVRHYYTSLTTIESLTIINQSYKHSQFILYNSYNCHGHRIYILIFISFSLHGY